MIPGPPRTVACPHCEALAWYMTLVSGNTLGARTWTDGKQVAPMLPHLPAVVKCRRCGRCYWLVDAKEVEKQSEAGIKRFLHATDTYLTLLNQAPASADTEKAGAWLRRVKYV